MTTARCSAASRTWCPGETAGVAAMVASSPHHLPCPPRVDLVKLRAVDDTGALDVTFFNQAWLKNNLHQGETYVFYGRAEGSLFRRQMSNPVVEPEGRREVTGRIVPIYPLTAGVSQLILSRSRPPGAGRLPPTSCRMCCRTGCGGSTSSAALSTPTRTSTFRRARRPWIWPGGG